MGGLKILLYHSVGEIDPGDSLGIRVGPDQFRGQMEALKESGYEAVSLKEAMTAPDKKVALTFDDGYKDNIERAVPILEKSGFHATFFITVGYIGSVKTSPKRAWQRWPCMDGRDLKALVDGSHEIGSHCVRHLDLRALSAKEKRDELKGSKGTLGALLNIEIDTLSYPYGRFDEDCVEIAKEAGYKAACTTISGSNGPSADPYRLKRIEVRRDDTAMGLIERLNR
jgi:peptidoglycan/xylan/chitin deacetylase (PgdA/CDA1 family)